MSSRGDHAKRPSATKKGPGRYHAPSVNTKAPRAMSAPTPSKKLPANIGGLNDGVKRERRVWRDGEPVHILKPVRAERIKAKRDAEAA